MKLTFIGTGSAFTLGFDNFQSNCLLSDDDGNRLLIDCGSDARHALNKINLTYKDISDVYISHLHADHAGGLEWLGFARKFDPDCEKPNIYIHEELVTPLWDNLLSAGMRSIERVDCNLQTYFNDYVISSDDPRFTWNGISFKLVKTKHVFDNETPVPCYALFFTIENISIFFTADAAFTPDLFQEYYEAADFIFHDCETNQYKSGVHANFAELAQLPESIKEKMWLYHYNPGPLPNAKEQGFRGFVQPRVVYDFNDYSSFLTRNNHAS